MTDETRECQHERCLECGAIVKGAALLAAAREVKWCWAAYGNAQNSLDTSPESIRAEAVVWRALGRSLAALAGLVG